MMSSVLYLCQIKNKITELIEYLLSKLMKNQLKLNIGSQEYKIIIISLKRQIAKQNQDSKFKFYFTID